MASSSRHPAFRTRLALRADAALRAALLAAAALPLCSEAQPAPSSPWTKLEEQVEAMAAKPVDKPVPGRAILFADALPGGAWEYNYGGRTTAKILGTKDRVLACYLDDAEWSGWTLGWSAPLDLRPLRTSGTLELLVRGAQGGERFWIGLIDDASDAPNRSVHSRVFSPYHVQVTTAWQRVSIPLSAFRDDGQWWDPDQKTNHNGQIDWSRITEFRISTDQRANSEAMQPNGPVRLYVDDIRIVPGADAAVAGGAAKTGAAAK